MEILNTLLTMPGHEIVTLLGYTTMIFWAADKVCKVAECMIKKFKEARIKRMKEKAQMYKDLLK